VRTSAHGDLDQSRNIPSESRCRGHLPVRSQPAAARPTPTRREKNREKPSQVSCWADWDPENEIKALSGAVLRSPCVIVTNQSNEPVFGAFIEYRNQNDDQPARVDVGTIPPGATKKVSVSEPFETPANWVPAALLPTMYFRDTRNRSGYRNTVGYLTRDPVLGAE